MSYILRSDILRQLSSVTCFWLQNHTGYVIFPPKSPIISGSFAQRDVSSRIQRAAQFPIAQNVAAIFYWIDNVSIRDSCGRVFARARLCLCCCLRHLTGLTTSRFVTHVCLCVCVAGGRGTLLD